MLPPKIATVFFACNEKPIVEKIENKTKNNIILKIRRNKSRRI
jgi:hypothetical protein